MIVAHNDFKAAKKPDATRGIVSLRPILPVLEKLVKRLIDPFLTNWFQDIINSVYIKGLGCIIVISCDE
jgi:hypothetical protein